MSEAEVPKKFGGFARGRELGRGASGTVFECIRLGDGEKFAAKAIDLRRLRLSAKADRELKKLQREVDILKLVPPHANLVRFVDALEEGSWAFLVLEFVPGGDLFSALVRRPASAGSRPCFREAETVHVLTQLVDGLDFLHSHGVIHRDLKLENILVVRQTRWPPNLLCDVKITDFGLSKVVGDGMSAAHSTVGSPRYIAPEVLAQGVHDFRADFWSLGVLLHVLLAGRFPADGPGEVVQTSIDAAIGRLEASAAARSVVLGLLQVDRERRTTMAAVRQHEWLKLASPSVDLGTPSKRPRTATAPAAPLPPASTISLFGSEDEEADSVVILDDAVATPPPPLVQAAAAAASSSASPPLKRPAPPAPAQPPLEEAEVSSIADLDCRGSGRAVRGAIISRSEHKTGGGFQLRLRDSTGEIDLRFWDGAAHQFRARPELRKGAAVRFEGFRIVALKPKDLPFAPSGRLHSLGYNAADSVRFLVEAEAPSELVVVPARMAPMEPKVVPARVAGPWGPKVVPRRVPPSPSAAAAAVAAAAAGGALQLPAAEAV